MTKDVAPRLTMTIRFKGIQRWKVRLWLAARCFWLGARIMNVGIRFER